MVRSFLLATAALVLGAAAAHAQRRPQAWVPGYNDPVSLDTLARHTDVPAPPPVVFSAATGVLEKLGVKITLRDSTARAVGNPSLELRRRLDGAPLSRYLNCGNGFSGPYADTWRITMALHVVAEPAAVGSRLGVSVAAGAEDPTGAVKAPVGCGSTGVLEKLIATHVLAQVAGVGGGASR